MTSGSCRSSASGGFSYSQQPHSRPDPPISENSLSLGLWDANLISVSVSDLGPYIIIVELLFLIVLIALTIVTVAH